MPDPAPSPTPVRRPSRWRRWFRAAEFAVQLTLVVLYGTYAVYYGGMTLRLRSAFAEMDRDHPGWRLADIEKRRESPPDAENSALRVLEVDASLPEHWIDDDLAGRVEKLAPRVRMTADQCGEVGRALDRVRPALEMARGLADMPKGRYPFVHQAGRTDPLLSRAGRAFRTTARLLYLDAAVRSQADEPGGAARSALAGLNAARSFGDEPGDLPQLARIAGVALSVKSASRLLAQTEPGPDDLEALQQEYEREERHPYWPTAWRGERALQADALDAFLREEIDFLEPEPGASRPSLIDQTLGYWYLQDRFRAWAPAFFAEYSLLENTDDMPPHRRQAVLDRTAQDSRRQLNVLLLGFPALAKVGQACARVQAVLRCEAAALAAERYRRAHGDWPATLDLPDDPFADGPLIYRRLADGAVVYSVGPDGKDDGGNVDAANPYEPGADVGVRLWDPAKRRQPPAAPAD